MDALPSELLVRIFVSGLLPYSGVEAFNVVAAATNVRSALTVSHVSKLWRTVSLAAPRLWTTLYSESERDFESWPTILARTHADGAKLDIVVRLSETNSRSRDSDATTNTWMSNLASHLHRAVRLSWHVASSQDLNDILHLVTTLPAPNLQHTFLLADADDPDFDALAMANLYRSTSLPRLREVTTTIVTGVIILRLEQPVQVLANVREFTLQLTRAASQEHSHVRRPTVDVTQLAHILYSAPNLESLRIIQGQIDCAMPSTFAAMDMGVPRCLRHVEFSSRIQSSDIFDGIFRVTAIESWAVGTAIFDEIPVECAGRLLNAVSSRRRLLLDLHSRLDRSGAVEPHPGQHECSYSSGRWVVRASSDDRRFTVEFQLNGLLVNGTALPTAIAHHHHMITHLAFRQSQWYQVSSAFSSIPLPNVRELVVSFVPTMWINSVYAEIYYGCKEDDSAVDGSWRYPSVAGFPSSDHAMELPALGVVTLIMDTPPYMNLRPATLSSATLDQVLRSFKRKESVLKRLELHNITLEDPSHALTVSREVVSLGRRDVPAWVSRPSHDPVVHPRIRRAILSGYE